MAAYAALTSAARSLEECFSDDDVTVLLDHGKKVEIFNSLLLNINSLLALLENFPEEAAIFEGRIRDVANEAEYLIEDFILKAQLGSEEEYSSNFQDVLLQELQKVNREVQSIKEEVRTHNINTGLQNLLNVNVYSHFTNSSISPPTRNDVMVGFDDQLDSITVKLYGEFSKDLKIIPILGMGGIGKTTLARNAFDDSATKRHFEVRAWATVSQGYSELEIFRNLLISCKKLKEKPKDDESLDDLKDSLFQILKEKRYLIVLDDVWSEKALEDLLWTLPNDKNGSRILLTTRVSQVATYASSSMGDSSSSNSHHSMRFLDVDQSWNLLCQRVFYSSSLACPPELVDIGMEIARRCGGLPLTIVVAAGILITVGQTQANWEKIAQNINIVETSYQRVENVLSLSYRHLPHHLRPCLLYMASFPEDYQLRPSELSRIWMAEGFVKTNGEEYIEDLARRSLVLVEERNICGKIEICSLHDLLRDLCIRKSKDEMFLRHHLRICSFKDRTTPRPTNLRTILSFEVTKVEEDNQPVLENMDTEEEDNQPVLENMDTEEEEEDRADDAYNQIFSNTETKFLRVIHAPSLSISDCHAVFSLFDLRYLHLRWIDCGSLTLSPEYIYRLKKLQTLILPDVDIELSFNIWKMPDLRHVHVYSLHLPYDDVAQNLSHQNIQKLSEVYNLVCSETMMKSMPNLKELRLFYQGMDLSNSQMENIVHLEKLETFDLVVSLKVEHVNYSPGVLTLPPSLRKLSLCHCLIEWQILGSVCSQLPNLQELQLTINGCHGDLWETNEDEFPELKRLEVGESDLKEWITESSHFPCLEYLSIYGCSNLKKIPDCFGEMSTIQYMHIENCWESIELSAIDIEGEQQGYYGNEALQLEIYRYEDSETG